MNRFMIAMIATAIVFLGVVFFKSQGNGPLGEVTKHSQGEGSSKVVLIEYGDFECPACGGYYPILKQVKEKFGDQITFQFRHFPIIQIHPNAMAAHRAAEAAGKQGKFFEMHDMLYERQQIWKSDKNVKKVFESYAQELGLNMEQYRTDVESREVLGIINADIKAGKEAGATGTPTFILDGKKIENPRDLDAFNKLIEDTIKAKNPDQPQ